jgi:hypothetical protein
MFAFIWILASMGVAYGAKISLRQPFPWFVIAAVLSPLVGSLLLWGANRWGVRINNII